MVHSRAHSFRRLDMPETPVTIVVVTVYHAMVVVDSHQTISRCLGQSQSSHTETQKPDYLQRARSHVQCPVWYLVPYKYIQS